MKFHKKVELEENATQKTKFSIKDFFSKCAFILKVGTSSNEQKPPVTSSNHYVKNINHQVTTEKIKISAKLYTFGMKTRINHIIPGKFGSKNEIYSQCYETWHSEQVKFVNL